MANPPRITYTTVVAGGNFAWHKIPMPPREWEPDTPVAVVDLTDIPEDTWSQVVELLGRTDG
jgi:hypothetical protein